MEDTEFKTLDLSPTVRGRPPKFERIALKCLYINARPITHEKYKDMMQKYCLIYLLCIINISKHFHIISLHKNQ